MGSMYRIDKTARNTPVKLYCTFSSNWLLSIWVASH